MPRGGPREAQEPPRAAQGPPRRAQGRPGTGARMTLEAPRPVKRASGGLPEAKKLPPEALKRLPRSPQREHAGTKTTAAGQQGTRQEETTEDEDKRSQDKRRHKRQKPAQHQTRLGPSLGDTRQEETRGEKCMLRNGAASLHGSTNVQKVCRIHEGRGHLSRRPPTSRAFNARVHSSIYICR